MRKLLVILILVPAITLLGYGAFQIVSRGYRYSQLIALGDQLLAEDLPFQATRTYDAAIALAPDQAVGFLKRAEAHHRQGNLVPALSDLQAAASVSSDVHLVSLRLASLYDELERFDEAASHYRRVLDLAPESPDILYKLGLVYFRAGREAESIEALNRAAAAREGFWEAYYLRSAVFRSLGAQDEAERDLLKALELRPDAAQARRALVDLYLEQGAAAKALPLVQAEIDANPEAPEPYLHLADVHRERGRTNDAIEAVSLALEQAPNLPSAYLRLGELWLEEAFIRGDTVALEKATSALESVTKMDPSDGNAALALGRAYLAAGDESRGFAELQRAGQATPIQAEAHRLLGDLYRARHNDAEAVTAYHIHLKLRGDSPAVLERLGDTYLDLGRPKTAAETYMQLASLEPRRVTPLVKAARAYLADGDRVSAASICRRGLSTNPENQTLLSLLAQARRGAPTREPSPEAS